MMTPVAHRELGARRQADPRGDGAVIGVHRSAPMPRAYGRTFESWFKKHTPLPGSGTRGQVIFFHGCAGQYFEVETPSTP